MREYASRGRATTRERSERMANSPTLNSIRDERLIERQQKISFAFSALGDPPPIIISGGSIILP